MNMRQVIILLYKFMIFSENLQTQIYFASFYLGENSYIIVYVYFL